MRGERLGRLRFGPLDELVDAFQAASPTSAMKLAAGKLREGVALDTLVTAAALANARAFGGEDYVGYHAFMAFMPALYMGNALPENERALPFLKVLHRSTAQIHQHRIRASGRPQAGGRAR